MPEGVQVRALEDDPSLSDSDLEASVGYNLKRAHKIMQSNFRQALSAEALSVRMFSVLSLVVQFPNVTQSALARNLGIERSGLVAIIDLLEALNFVTRAPVPGDRRAQALVPSTEGKQAYARALDEVRRHEEDLLSDLTDAERDTLLGLLRKVRGSGTSDPQ